jgi:hypothetical protein
MLARASHVTQPVPSPHLEWEAEQFNMSQKAPGQRSKDVSVDKMLTFPTFPKLHRSSEAMIWNL